LDCLSLSLPVDLPVERREHRRELQKKIDQQSRLLDYRPRRRVWIDYYQRALAMLEFDAHAGRLQHQR